jgi:hypothetical protein
MDDGRRRFSMALSQHRQTAHMNEMRDACSCRSPGHVCSSIERISLVLWPPTGSFGCRVNDRIGTLEQMRVYAYRHIRHDIFRTSNPFPGRRLATSYDTNRTIALQQGRERLYPEILFRLSQAHPGCRQVSVPRRPMPLPR